VSSPASLLTTLEKDLGGCQGYLSMAAAPRQPYETGQGNGNSPLERKSSGGFNWFCFVVNLVRNQPSGSLLNKMKRVAGVTALHLGLPKKDALAYSRL
jgi:hypothetical protein